MDNFKNLLNKVFPNFKRKEEAMTDTVSHEENLPIEKPLDKPIKIPQKPESISKVDHKHEWELILKTYAAPRHDVNLNDANITQDFLEKMLFGLTILVWACVVCKEVRESKVLGSDEDRLNELLEKANQYGPQYLQKDGQTYVIAKYQAQNPSQTQNLPVR